MPDTPVILAAMRRRSRIEALLAIFVVCALIVSQTSSDIILFRVDSRAQKVTNTVDAQAKALTSINELALQQQRFEDAVRRLLICRQDVNCAKGVINELETITAPVPTNPPSGTTTTTLHPNSPSSSSAPTTRATTAPDSPRTAKPATTTTTTKAVPPTTSTTKPTLCAVIVCLGRP